MAGNDEPVVQPPFLLWQDKQTKKIIRKKRNGRLVVCWCCPCCNPRVLASAITNRSTGNEKWDLKPYQRAYMGLPGQRWRIRDVGESHHADPGQNCSGVIYNNGSIDNQGRLVDLPDEFISSYSYNGYMQLQMGCVREDGSVEWPCPNG